MFLFNHQSSPSLCFFLLTKPSSFRVFQRPCFQYYKLFILSFYHIYTVHIIQNKIQTFVTVKEMQVRAIISEFGE